MSAIENATNFFHACDSAKGWDECSQYVAEGASFHAQSEPLVDITTVEGYAIWMAEFSENVVPGCSYEIHSSAFDDDTKTAVFFATFTGKHTGDGGPIPPTNKETNTHYVYIFSMNDDDKIAKMQKVWNAPWALKELGWM
jgi:hypothetical protein